MSRTYNSFKACVKSLHNNIIVYTLNANMADHSVVARDESNESEASWASMFC